MEIWHLWTHAIAHVLGLATSQFGVSEAIAIIAVTLAARLAMFPLSFASAYKAQKNKVSMMRIKPQIEQLRERLKSDPAELARQTMTLYRDKGIHFFDKTTVLNMGTQSIVGLGFFQALKNISFNSKFLWITNIGKADIFLSIIVGALMFASMSLMPGAVEQSSLLLLLIPVLISVFALISFPSAIGLYWATSNLVTVMQTLVLRWMMSRQTHLRA
jgi:YidC/Oxa1 family membrane protein insertase